MPFDSTLPNDGLVKLHAAMTKTYDWFQQDPSRWIQRADFNHDRTKACAFGGVALHHADIGNVPGHGWKMQFVEPYFLAATGLTFQELAKGNDAAPNFKAAMDFFLEQTRKVGAAILNGIDASKSIAELESARERERTERFKYEFQVLLGTPIAPQPYDWTFQYNNLKPHYSGKQADMMIIDEMVEPAPGLVQTIAKQMKEFAASF